MRGMNAHTPLPQLVCPHCGRAAGPLDWHCDGHPLEIAGPPPFDAAAIDQAEWSMWRYAAALPVTRRVSLGEGLTPLVPLAVDGLRFQAKLEYLNPTGSYKDRGTAALLSYLLTCGVAAVVEDSSGNAGASLAAYCAAAGVRARICVPAGAPAGKKRLIERFGAALVEVPGPRAAATEAARQAAREMPYASHAWSPLFIAGQMTCAWEIWERGGPVEAAAQGPTVADGIVVTLPLRADELLAALRASGGAALRVSDAAVRAAQAALARRGLLVEPTGAVGAAALADVRRLAGAGAEIVVPLTGSGLKTLP